MIAYPPEHYSCCFSMLSNFSLRSTTRAYPQNSVMSDYIFISFEYEARYFLYFLFSAFLYFFFAPILFFHYFLHHGKAAVFVA